MAEQGFSTTGERPDPIAAITAMTGGTAKTISPRMHGVLDYGVAATFLALGVRLRRQHPRASALAFVNGAMVLGLALVTDYPLGVWRRVSFDRGHRTADMMQAGLAAAGPLLLGFAKDPEANYFYGQALSEVGVIAATDWNAPPR